MRAETLRAGKEERVRKRSRQHTVEASSQGKEEGEQLAAAPGAPWSPCPHAESDSASHLTAAHPRGSGAGVLKSPNRTLNFAWMKVRPVLLDPEPG